VQHAFVRFAVASAALFVLCPGPSPMAPMRASDPSREVARISRHLLGAEMLLASRDLSLLTPGQRSARRRLIADLRSYRRHGVFPHNHRLPDRRTPVFVDEHGTRCAMAYLIERSGDRALVARIASTRNLARIRELAGDPELVAWLEQNGLTLAEAARIQPDYPGGTYDANQGSEANGLAAVGVAVGFTGAALNLSVAETRNARNTHGLMGVACGITGAALGIPALTEDGGVRALGVVDIGLGVASLALGIHQLGARIEDSPPSRAALPAFWRDRRGVTRLALVAKF
jgi:hypothetical protein